MEIGLSYALSWGLASRTTRAVAVVTGYLRAVAFVIGSKAPNMGAEAAEVSAAVASQASGIHVASSSPRHSGGSGNVATIASKALGGNLTRASKRRAVAIPTVASKAGARGVVPTVALSGSPIASHPTVRFVGPPTYSSGP